MRQWKIQCLNCDSTLQSWDCSCDCGMVIVKNGQRTWPFFPVRNISLWTSPTGKVLPQHIVDHHFNLKQGSQQDQHQYRNQHQCEPRRPQKGRIHQE
jgi:hypothetical protein